MVRNITNWHAAGANKHKRLAQQLCKKVFKKKAYEDHTDAVIDGLPYKGHDHREAIVQLFEIHEIVPNLAEGGKEFDDEDFYQNVIVETLKSKARVKYAKRGGKNLRNQDNVLDLLEESQEGIELEIEVNVDQKRRCGNEYGKCASTNNNDDNSNKNWCRKPNHKHLWKNCPENPNLDKYEGDKNRQRDGGRRNEISCHRERDNKSDCGGRHSDRDRSSDRPNRDTRGRHRDSRRSNRREVSSNETRSNTSSIGSPFVRFVQTRDSISGNSRQSRSSIISTRRSRSSSTGSQRQLKTQMQLSL